MELKVENLSKSFGDVRALDDVSFICTPGIYGLLGPNGAGKSTLIHLLTDNLARDAGKILWNGADILKESQNFRAILGYMPQEQGYYADFPAGAFLMYMAHLKGLGRKQAKNRVDELLETFHIEKFRSRRVGNFSGGMKQRLLLAQALLNDPKLLILDEPTAGVDPQERINIRNYIGRIAADRVVLVATHIVPDVEAIAKEIILMQSGRIIEKDTPENLVRKIDGNVWTARVSEEQLAKMQDSCLISNIKRTGQGVVLKMITASPPEGAVLEKQSTLEDVYLYYCGKELM